VKSGGAFAHQVLSQKRGADEIESGEMPEEPKGKRANVFSREQAAAAAEQRGGEEGGRVGGEQKEGELGEEGMSEGEDESWRERIDLRAVECCEHRVRLSTPPFPFRQFWDSQYDTKEKRNARKNLRAQRRASPDYTLGSRA